MNLTPNELREWLISRVAEAAGLNASQVDLTEPFATFGLGSREAVVLSGELKELLDTNLPPTLIFEYPTVKSLTDHLVSRMKGAVEESAPLLETLSERGEVDSLVAEIEELSEDEAQVLLSKSSQHRLRKGGELNEEN